MFEEGEKFDADDAVDEEGDKDDEKEVDSFG